jgi:hypothetical protein
MRLAAILFILTAAATGAAQDHGAAARTMILPAAIPWEGASRSLMVGKSDPWITPSERSDLRTTPRYDETVAWLRALVSASPELHMLSLGKSPEGRDIWMVIASRERKFTPEELKRSGKPSVFAQAGIHAGEIDGKDAGMMLLRDMTVRGTKRDLLDHANFLFVPIFSVDGHERFSAFSRINQRGPQEAGWRTNARNLNLNRDYTKLDTPEMRAMVRALDRWDPDLYLDLHVTDGADYQYDITFGHNGPHAYSPSIARWIESVVVPSFTADLAKAGHIPGPFVWFLDEFHPEKGVFQGVTDLRLSTGYGDARHIPSVLVETHSLKPYDQRVLGTYVLLESALRAVGRSAPQLRQAIREDRQRRPERLPIAWAAPKDTPPPVVDFLGIESRVVPSAISGSLVVQYTGKPALLRVPVVAPTEVSASVSRPRAYWIPPAWQEVIERLQLHGIRMERIPEAREVEVEMYRLSEPKLASETYEGHVRVSATPVIERRRERFPANSVRVTTNQPLGNLAVLLLEPAAPDSFFQWGFFPEPLQQTEYVESYVMVPMAERMLEADPRLAEEFRKKLAEDEPFRSSATARLQWFYSRTPFFDERWRLYPIGRE